MLPDGPHPAGGGSEGSTGGASGTDGWRVAVRQTTYWAISRRQLTRLVLAAGFTDPRWEDPDDPEVPGPPHPSALPKTPRFFQPVLSAAASGPS